MDSGPRSCHLSTAHIHGANDGVAMIGIWRQKDWTKAPRTLWCKDILSHAHWAWVSQWRAFRVRVCIGSHHCLPMSQTCQKSQLDAWFSAAECQQMPKLRSWAYIMSANAQKKLRPNIMKPLFGQSWNIRHLPGRHTLREHWGCTKASSKIGYRWLWPHQ